jgi:FtsP/CotA-like multicopper oxidase with cupredoxin domain
MRRKRNKLSYEKFICVAFLGMTIVPAGVSANMSELSELRMPVSISSGATKSLQAELEVKSGRYTLPGISPTPQIGSERNPVVNARGVKLTRSEPVSSIPITNDLLMGPTLRIRPGDQLDVLFKNSLKFAVSAGDGGHSTTIPHGFDVINLHTHGLHVSPKSPGDNVLISIFPKGTPQKPLQACYSDFGKDNCVTGSYAYSYSIPDNHPSGTFWYHAHKHGAVSMHLADGIAGALIIEDPVNGLESWPAVQAAREKIILLQQISYGGDYQNSDGSKPSEGSGSGTQSDPYRIDCMSVYQDENGCAFEGKTPVKPKIINNTLSVNGQFQPTISMWTDEVQLWRVINGSIGKVTAMCLLPVDGGNEKEAPDRPEAYVLAADGIPLQNPAAGEHDLPVLLTRPVTQPANGNELLNNELLFLSAGQRLDLMVKAPAKPGAYALYDSTADPIDKQCLASTYQGKAPILTVSVQSTASEIAYNTKIPTQQALNGLTTPATITAEERPELPTQGVVFGFTDKTFAAEIGGASAVNARVFNPMRSQRNLALDQVDLWSVQSASDIHMFHIHINSFQLVSRGQIAYPFPIWRDTLLINQPTQSGSGEIVQFLQKPLDFTGSLVMHCHNVFHEDNGMMELVEILPLSGK